MIKYAKEKESITNLILNPLDLTLRAAQNNMVNQEMLIDTHGLLGRKYSDSSQTTFEDEQIRIINNSILFTDDNWNTVKAAFGKIYYDEDDGTKTAYGLIAKTLIGELIMGQTLKIKNENSSVVINASGIEIKNNNTNESVFKADTNGSLSLTGVIHATKGGTIGGYNIGETDLTSGGVGMSSKKGTDSNNNPYVSFWAGNTTPNDALFKVTNDGKLYATAGEIGGYIIGTNDLTSSNVGISSDTTTNAIAFWAGKTKTDNDSAPFRVDNTGKVWLTKGLIGNLTITDKGLTTDYFELVAESGTNVDGETGTIGVLRIGTADNDYPTQITESIIKSPYAEIDVIKSASLTTDVMRINDELHTDKLVITDTLEIVGTNGGTKTDFVAKLTFNYVSMGTSLTTGSGLTLQRYTITIYDTSGNVVNIPINKTFTVKVDPNNPFDSSIHTYSITVYAGHSSNYYQEDKWYWGVNDYYFSNGSKQLSFSMGGSSDNTMSVNANIIPIEAGKYYLGSNSKYWDYLYVNNIYNINGAANIITSNRNKKNTIQPITQEYDKFYDSLIPVSFKYNAGKSGRTHFGFIAQDIKNSIISSGYTTQDFATYCEWEDDNGETDCGIRYTELIPLNVLEIQKLKKEIKILKDELDVLKKGLT